ncbi:MAG: hypothetical protein J6B75_05350 [Ruminococcus sp.]|nr:hypothetical protein [Ruminococcus sp.]
MDSTFVAGFALFFVLIYGVILLVSIGMAVLQIIASWKLYEKAGEPGWSAIVPIYNYMQMIKIALGSYKLAWIYLIFCGGYMVFAIAGSMINVLGEQSDELVVIQIAAMCMAFLMIVPLYIIAGYTSYMFAKSYGKSTAFCVLSIFFSQIMILIMGFDKNTCYVGPKGVPYTNL